MSRQIGADRELTLNLTTHPTGLTFTFNAFQSTPFRGRGKCLRPKSNQSMSLAFKAITLIWWYSKGALLLNELLKSEQHCITVTIWFKIAKNKNRNNNNNDSSLFGNKVETLFHPPPQFLFSISQPMFRNWFSFTESLVFKIIRAKTKCCSQFAKLGKLMNIQSRLSE